MRLDFVITGSLCVPLVLGVVALMTHARDGSYTSPCPSRPGLAELKPVVVTTYKTVCKPEIWCVARSNECGRRSVKVKVVREVSIPVRRVLMVDP
jgi:hypothetical protein